MLKFLEFIMNLFQDSGCMPVQDVQGGQMLSIGSVDEYQTMIIYEQWLYASSEQIREGAKDSRVSPSFTYKGVFTLFILINFLIIF